MKKEDSKDKCVGTHIIVQKRLPYTDKFYFECEKCKEVFKQKKNGKL